MKNKLRLILFEKCNRTCPGCCNNDYDLEALPVCDSFEGYDEVILTGGEPMLQPQLVKDVCADIMSTNSSAKILMYTAKSKPAKDLVSIAVFLDGITLTLHEQYDAPNFAKLIDEFGKHHTGWLSLRANVFDNVDISDVDVPSTWNVRTGYKWIKDRPLPEGETLMRYWR